jgi:hypothetical protein
VLEGLSYGFDRNEEPDAEDDAVAADLVELDALDDGAEDPPRKASAWSL